VAAESKPDASQDAADPKETSDQNPAPAEKETPPPTERETQAPEAAARPVAKSPLAANPAQTAGGLGKSGDLRFNFSGVTWPAVLEWFANEADLALQLDQIPIGSWTFADPTRTYSISEALDVINLALLKRGYCLVRRGRMLQVIDLEQQNADKLISELAELVRPEQLEERGRSDIVSCVFPLGSMAADAAKEELALMIGPWGRVIVLDSARQVKVTEAADKLIAIRDLLKKASTADTDVVEIVWNTALLMKSWNSHDLCSDWNRVRIQAKESGFQSVSLATGCTPQDFQAKRGFWKNWSRKLTSHSRQLTPMMERS
jgi:hypothetical protein